MPENKQIKANHKPNGPSSDNESAFGPPLRLPKICRPVASLYSIEDSSVLYLHVAAPCPNHSIAEQLLGHIQFGLYEGPDMPGGLVLIKLGNESGMSLTYECPYDFDENAERTLDSMLNFFLSEPVLVQLTLSDNSLDTNPIMAVRVVDLPEDLKDRLTVPWLCQTGSSSYRQEYEQLISRKCVAHIWAQSRKF